MLTRGGLAAACLATAAAFAPAAPAGSLARTAGSHGVSCRGGPALRPAARRLHLTMQLLGPDGKPMGSGGAGGGAGFGACRNTAIVREFHAPVAPFPPNGACNFALPC